ncbi:hypothetical protein BDF19DRAFT_442116 [Syncephalis fuscata]|nr:hypothetical protein BDF19DRAFT_442116 [Syncephalis fuscata]
MKFNDTPPPKVTPAPNKSITLPMILVLGTMGFAAYKIYSSLSTLIDGPKDALTMRYDGNRVPDWHPLPFKKAENGARSPCPLLNTLANHGYLPRDGRNINSKALNSALGHINLSPTVRNTLVDGVKPIMHARSGADKDTANEDDLSLIYYRPALGKDRHWRADKTLVEQLKGFADKDGFLDYNAVARARNLRQIQSNEELAQIKEKKTLTDEADTRNVEFGLNPQKLAHGECSALLLVLGRNGKIHTSSIDSFVIDERIPKDWAPPKNEVGLPDFLVGAGKCALYRYFPQNCSPVEPKAEKPKSKQETGKNADTEHAEL